ncbi:MAG TPA: hypothetical protein VNO26_00685 [Candidatus Limnocylindria bacterium]|nr:hypothetical protein [Candidatus Limnocylindria bacterium]
MEREEKRLQLVLWGAFVLGVALYPSALTIIVHQWRPPYDSDVLARLQVDCMLGGAAQTVAALWFFRRGETLLAAGHHQRALWSYAVAWALSEAIGLYGLTVGLWRAAPEVSTLFFTWAIALVLLFRPPAARAAGRLRADGHSMSDIT